MSRPKGLSREAVAKAALAIAETEGIDAVKFRPLAAACGVAANSLYHHIDTGYDLWLAMIEQRHGAELAERLGDELVAPATLFDPRSRDALVLVAKLLAACDYPFALLKSVGVKQ